MNFIKRNKSIMDFLFILVLFGTFVISAMLVLIMGANVYSETVNISDTNYKARTAYYYITEKIKAHDKAGTIEVNNTSNSKSVGLVFYDYVDEVEYKSYIYYYAGYLTECTISKDEEFNYYNGTKLLKLKDFRAEIEGDNLIHLYIKDEDNYVSDFYIATKVPLRDVTFIPIVGSDGPEKTNIDKKGVTNLENQVNQEENQ